MKSTMKTRTGLVALAIALPLSLAACGSSSDAATPAAGNTPAASTPADTMSSTPSDTMTSSESMDATAAVFGEGLPAKGADDLSFFYADASQPCPACFGFAAEVPA